VPSSINKQFRQLETLREADMTRVHDIYPNDRVSLREVGLRDGLQLVKTFPSTAAKQRWVRAVSGRPAYNDGAGVGPPANRLAGRHPAECAAGRIPCGGP
jgi:hypothetical protein